MTNDNMFQQMSDKEVINDYQHGVAAAFQIPERYLFGNPTTSPQITTQISEYCEMVREHISMTYDTLRRVRFDGRPALPRYGLPMETNNEIFARLTHDHP